MPNRRGRTSAKTVVASSAVRTVATVRTVPPSPHRDRSPQPVLETGGGERRALTGHERALGRMRAEVGRVGIGHDRAGVPVAGQATPHELVEAELLRAGHLDDA